MECSKMRGLLRFLILLLFCSSVSNAIECQLFGQNPYRVLKTIVVDKFGRGNFVTIQSAIDSIPLQNQQWIRIQINPAVYWEQVTIPEGKSCIFLDGGDSRFTEIQFDGHLSTESSPTFASFAENLLIRGITFRNVYNDPGKVTKLQDIKPALAARIEGDKVKVYDSSFIGLQDTLWDGGRGRHYYYNCYIQGVIDIISGYAQTIFEECEIRVSINLYGSILTYGYITAQGKSSPTDTGGYVFKRCKVSGTSGLTYLGRAYGPFSTVIFYETFLADFIEPLGWSIWQQAGHEGDITYAEVNCHGAGADMSRRVPWLKRLTGDEVRHYAHLSFIDQDGWTSRVPTLTPF